MSDMEDKLQKYKDEATAQLGKAGEASSKTNGR